MILGLRALPNAAHAFSDPQVFADDTQLGGGGGRFFTGSPLDGYTCAVCHRGGPTPQMRIFGFPQNYEPGTTYEVEVQWDEPQVPHALNLELVNQSGDDMNVRLVSESKVGADGRCDRKKDGEIATTLVKRGARRIVAVSDCYAANARFRFTAPSRAAVALSVGLVRADSSEDAEGDGVWVERRLSQPGDSSELVSSAATCSASRAESASLWGVLLGVCAGLFLRRKRMHI
jgi:hypothetical protein